MGFKLVAPEILSRSRHDEYRKVWFEYSYLEGKLLVKDGIVECERPETVEYLKTLGYTPIEEADKKVLEHLGLVKPERLRRPRKFDLEV